MRTTYKLVLSAMFLALGLILPFLTGQIQQIGNLLLPMHFTVFLCTFICGWKHGTVVGFILPLLRTFLFGAPILYPNAIAMSVELCFYGFVAGLIYKKIKSKNILSVYFSILPAMLVGRVVWGLAQLILLGLKEQPFSFQLFISSAFINAIPGILLQLVLIPFIVSMFNRTFMKARVYESN